MEDVGGRKRERERERERERLNFIYLPTPLSAAPAARFGSVLPSILSFASSIFLIGTHSHSHTSCPAFAPSHLPHPVPQIKALFQHDSVLLTFFTRLLRYSRRWSWVGYVPAVTGFVLLLAVSAQTLVLRPLHYLIDPLEKACQRWGVRRPETMKVGTRIPSDPSLTSFPSIRICNLEFLLHNLRHVRLHLSCSTKPLCIDIYWLPTGARFPIACGSKCLFLFVALPALSGRGVIR
jgi:hypothetical protein